MYKNTFQTKSSKKRSVKEVITKNPGKSTWSDRDKGVLSDRGYKVVKQKKVERTVQHHNGKENPEEGRQYSHRVSLFH